MAAAGDRGRSAFAAAVVVLVLIADGKCCVWCMVGAGDRGRDAGIQEGRVSAAPGDRCATEVRRGHTEQQPGKQALGY